MSAGPFGQVALLFATRLTEIGNRARAAMSRSRFRVAVLMIFSLAFWWGLYRIFYLAMRFLKAQELAQFMTGLIEAIFHAFFFALTLMLIFSNAIITYASYYRSRETAFLLTRPLGARAIVFYKYTESLIFSLWAFLFIGLPLMAAYAKAYGISIFFVPAALGIFLIYMFIPASIGSAIAMFIANFLPRSRRAILTAVVLVSLGALTLVGLQLLSMRSQYGISAMMMATREILSGVEFSAQPIWPSTWISRALLGLAAGEVGRAGFFVLVVLANALCLTVAVRHVAPGGLRQGWFQVQGARRTRRVRLGRWIDRIVEAPLRFLSREVRLIVIKDLKSLIRDPVQGSQFLIFFGLLGIYFLNLRTFHYEDKNPFWRTLIAQLNLLATCLTMATFAGRFVFPQVSLEGRRFWVLGMIPMQRDRILHGKMALCFLVCVVIGETLIGLSGVMLKIPLALLLLQMVTLFGICLGLSGMAVGFGALYPDFREEDPSKIVSGFGGTLNLVLMLGFVLLALLIQAIPCLMLVRQRLPGGGFTTAAAAAMVAIGALSLAACLIPMALGLRAIRRLEI